MTTITILVREYRHPSGKEGFKGYFEARVEGRQEVLCRSTQPFLEAARRLARIALAEPGAILVMRHEGSDTVALHGRLLDAAKVSVVERDRARIAFEKWQPSQSAEAFD